MLGNEPRHAKRAQNLGYRTNRWRLITRKNPLDCHLLMRGLLVRSLALRPAHSRGHLYVTRYTEGFSHFVTSMTAPVASGWSVRRVGLAPTGKRRLLTAHANSGHSPDGGTNVSMDPNNRPCRRPCR